MSIKAVCWALDLQDERLKPSAALVLVAICDAAYEDKNWECALKHTTIARKAKMSEDSVSKQIAHLRSIGYLHVVKHRGEDGKQLTNRYVVLIDEAARRHAFALGWDGAIRSEERTEELRGESEPTRKPDAADPQFAGRADPQNEDEPTRKFDPADPHCCGSVINDFNEFNDSPSKSPDDAREGGASRNLENRTGEPVEAARALRRAGADARIARWEAFRKAWPWDGGEMPDHARRVFMQLGDDEQAEAVEGGPRYIADRRTRGKMIAHAKTWLDGKGWQALKARSVESAAALGGAGFFVAVGTAQFWRWLDYHRGARDVRLAWRDTRDGSISAEGRQNAELMPMLFEIGGRKGFWRKSEWPPATPRPASPNQPDPCGASP